MVKAEVDHSQVRRFFRPQHRHLLVDDETMALTGSEDELAPEVPQIAHDDSTKCIANCEPTCGKLDVPGFLAVNIALFG